MTSIAHRPAGVIEDARQRAVALTGVCAALIAVQVSVVSLTVALPAIAAALEASPGEALWVVNAYTVTLAALLLPFGAIGDRIGRRPMLLAGLAVFGTACVGAPQAGSVEMLIALRVVAGIGGAMILPATLSVITSSFPEEHRGNAIGVWAGCAGAGGIVGLVAASLIIDELTWPWVFAAILVPAVVGFILVVLTVPDSREGRGRSYDWRGAVLSAAAIGGLVLAIQEGPERGWTDALTVVGLCAGVLGLFGWVVVSYRVPAPLLDLRLFRLPRLAGGSLGLLILFATNFGMALVLIQYIITLLEYSAVRAAMSILPFGIVMVLTASISPRFTRSVSATVTVTLGLAGAALGLGMAAVQADSMSYGVLLPGLVVFGVGVGLAMAPATTGITESLPSHQQGVASALNDTVRELGGALRHRGRWARPSTSGTARRLTRWPTALIRSLLRWSVKGSPPPTPLPHGFPLRPPARSWPALGDAFVDGWRTSMGLGAACLAVTTVVTMLILRRAGPNPAVVLRQVGP